MDSNKINKIFINVLFMITEYNNESSCIMFDGYIKRLSTTF